MARKTFRVAIAAEPISFDLEGPVTGIQNFHCRDRIGAGTLMRFAEAFSTLDPDDNDPDDPKSAAKGADAIPIIKDFFNTCLVPEARDRFWAMINNDDDAIPMDTMVEIAGWLAEVYSGDRPTGPTSSGTSGATSTGDASRATEPQPDTQMYSRSEPTPVSV